MYSIVSISMQSDDRDGRTTSFFFHLNNQTSVVLMKYEVLVFKVFSSGLTNLVTLIHEYPHLVSLVVVSYWKLRSFQGNQANFSGLLEKSGITYPSKYEISRAKLRN